MRKSIIRFFRAILRRDIYITQDPTVPFVVQKINLDTDITVEALGLLQKELTSWEIL